MMEIYQTQSDPENRLKGACLCDSHKRYLKDGAISTGQLLIKWKGQEGGTTTDDIKVV